MRVITGSARGCKLQSPLGMETRPTSEMVKEAVFSMVQFEVEGAVVLDLFAGSGQMGIEALSRGAHSAILVDNSRAAQELIRQNLLRAKVEQRARLSQSDAKAFLASQGELFDIAFLDPPYQQDQLATLLPLVVARMRPSGIILCETERQETLPDELGTFHKKREYIYANAKITTYRQREE